MKKFIITKKHFIDEANIPEGAEPAPIYMSDGETESDYCFLGIRSEYQSGFTKYIRYDEVGLQEQILRVQAGYSPNVMDGHCSVHSALASKTTVEGYSLFKRCHGMGTLTLDPEESGHFEFQIGYDWAKLEGIQIVGQGFGIIADLYIEDDDEGTYTLAQSGLAVPRAILNQFGFDVALPKDFCEKKSTFDADLFYGMWVVLQVTNTSPEIQTLWANIEINEVRK